MSKQKPDRIQKSDVIYTAELAVKLGMKPSAVRMAVARDRARPASNRALPKHFRVGAKLAWSRAEIDSWIAGK